MRIHELLAVHPALHRGHRPVPDPGMGSGSGSGSDTGSGSGSDSGSASSTRWPHAIVIVGATCAGKTTLVDAIRAAALPRVDVPERRVTRPPRADDHPAEAITRTPAEFAADIAAGTIAIHWRRHLAPDRVERYGFVPAAPGHLPVYSANDAILAPDAALVPADLLARALVVGIDAPDAVRAARLHARSPDLCRDAPAEVAARLAPPPSPLATRVHLLLDNAGPSAAAPAAALVALVTAVAHHRSHLR